MHSKEIDDLLFSIVVIAVNRQRKWATSGTKVNGT